MTSGCEGYEYKVLAHIDIDNIAERMVRHIFFEYEIIIERVWPRDWQMRVLIGPMLPSSNSVFAQLVQGLSSSISGQGPIRKQLTIPSKTNGAVHLRLEFVIILFFNNRAE